MTDNPFRKLPQVARVLDAPALAAARAAHPPDALTAAVRAELDALRARLAAGASDGVPTADELAELALARGVRLIHVSTVDALAAAARNRAREESELEPAKPRCAYVISKRLAESAVLQAVNRGLDAVIVNPGFMVGPYFCVRF